MTRPIRAFMLIRSGVDEWVVSVCRDLEAVLEAWAARPAPEQTGVLHIGFDRPPSSDFEIIARRFPGRLLLTASAKFGLPQGYEASADAIDDVNGLPIHLGTRGWGYHLEDSELQIAKKPSTLPLRSAPTGWLVTFLQFRPDLAEEITDAGILDDEDYLQRECGLSWEARYRSGVFRFHALLGEQDHDPCAMARSAPPWLKERAVETMGLPVRVSNVFDAQQVATVADIQKFVLPELLRTPNFGRKSANDLRSSLLKALEEGPFSVQAKIENAGVESLRVELHRTLASLNERERDILTRRMGLGGQSETLQAIADDYDVTRERIRQIESKTVTRLIKESYWDDLLSGKLDVLLAGREFPLPVLGVEAVDSWFAGVSEWPQALRYILTNLCGDRVGIVEVDGIDYLGFLQQAEWDGALVEAARALSYGASQKNWTETHCKAIITPLIQERAREFRGLFWEKSSKHCHFGEGGRGERALIAYGRGADQVVEAVLSNAERPLHYSEIAERASERQGRHIDARRAHNSAASVGILLGRGTYGLERHIGLSTDDGILIREEAEIVVLEGPPARQWHSAELLSALVEREAPVAGLDKYALDFVLRRSPVLQRLGRMTWVAAPEGGESPQSRIDIRQAILAVLDEAGRPLTTGQIHQRLVAVRGVNEIFQFAAVDPLIRVGIGLWGLNDRDLPIKRNDQAALVEDLVKTLNRKGSGIHISEVEMLAPPAWPGLSPAMIFSLAGLDSRLRVGVGQYLYLDAWGSPRRETVLETVRHILLEAEGPLTVDVITDQAERRLGLEELRGKISGCLQSLEAIFDPVHRTWLRSSVAPGVADEDELAAEIGPAAGFGYEDNPQAGN